MREDVLPEPQGYEGVHRRRSVVRRTVAKTLVELQTMASDAVLRVRGWRHIRSLRIHRWRFTFRRNGASFRRLRTKPRRLVRVSRSVGIAASKLHRSVRACQARFQMYAVIELYCAGINAPSAHSRKFRMA